MDSEATAEVKVPEATVTPIRPDVEKELPIGHVVVMDAADREALSGVNNHVQNMLFTLGNERDAWLQREAALVNEILKGRKALQELVTKAAKACDCPILVEGQTWEIGLQAGTFTRMK